MSNWKLRREQMLRAEKEYSLKNKGKLLNFIHGQIYRDCKQILRAK